MQFDVENLVLKSSQKIHIPTGRKLTEQINAPSPMIGIFTALFNTSFGIIPIIAGIFTVWSF